MIHCENVTKYYGSKPVLDGISLDLHEGQIFGLLGPSGAGKTTLIKILTGQLSYESGSVQVFGHDVRKLTGEEAKRFGIMMDQFGVYERLSCQDNLKIYADIFRIPYARIEETLKLVGLGDAMKKPAANLSKGMGARLRLARVFMHNPSILFLDEPTSGLDPQSMRAIHQLILEKKRQGCTIFLTTHNMEEATALCDIVALLNEGHIVEMGEPKEICRKYNHKKSITMHLVSGEEYEIILDRSCAQKVYELMRSETVETIHSSEPNLETVFLEITGRKLEDA